MTNAPVTDMTPMDASKLKGMIEKYREMSSAAAVSFTASLNRKPARRGAKKPGPSIAEQWAGLGAPPTIAELDAQRRVISAEIDRLYGVVDNVYPKEMFERFCEVTEKLVKQTQGQLIELLAIGADGPGVQATAKMFCDYNNSVVEMVAFNEERKAKALSSWAYLAALTGVGSLLMMNYLGNRKKPA